MNEDYIEKCIIKTAVESKDFLSTISAVYVPEYFNDVNAANIFIFLRDHIKEYNIIPDKEVIVNSIPESENISNYFKEIESMDYDIAKNYDWLFQQSNEYLKIKALQKGVMDVADIIEKKGNIYESRSIIEEALCKDMKISLGHDYWNDMQERLKRIFTTEDKRIPTYYPQIDSILNGGFPPKTLSVWISRIHGFKSQWMANVMARQVLNKHNVALASLEMSEDMFSQRFDGIYSNLDINKIYYNTKIRKEFLKRISEMKKKEKGNLWIKEYPTGAATINDFRIWLRELEMRGKKPEAFYFDYISLVRNMGKERGLYEDKKAIAEEARALGYEFDIPVISVSQINRAGSFLPLEEIDFNYIQESVGVAATADFCSVSGNNEDEMVYESEIWYKIIKNRLGGMVGTMDKYFYDQRSLKMYDSSELDLWIQEATLSGDVRENKKKK